MLVSDLLGSECNLGCSAGAQQACLVGKSTAAPTVKQSEACITCCCAMLSTLLYIGVSCSVGQIAVMLPGSNCCNALHQLRHVFAC